MKKLYILFILTSFLGFSQNPGDIVITEIMQNPGLVSDDFGEWFEVYNTTGSAIDLDGWIIRDEEGANQNLVTIMGSVIVPAGGYITLGRGGITDPADAEYNGGVTHAYVYDATFLMANGADEIILEAPGAIIIDQVYYDGGTEFPDPTGASMQLDPASISATGNDTGANWCEATTEYGGGDLGTPAAANTSCVPTCQTFLGTSEAICDSVTVGDTSDTYTATLEYSGAATGETFTVISTAGTVDLSGGNDPTNDASGTITVTGIPEGTDITITVDNTADGGLCNLVRSITSPICEPVTSIELELQGVIDFDLSGSDGKAIHVVATGDIADLSVYGLGVANNGGGTDGLEYTFDAITNVVAGDHILVARNLEAMELYLTTEGYNLFDYVLLANDNIAQNGNDAIELYKNGVLIETFGDPDLDGSGETWEYTDSWAYKSALGAVWPDGWYYGDATGCASGTTTFDPEVCTYPFVASLLSSDEFTADTFSIYPNPVKNGFVTITSQIQGTKNVQLTDSMGRTVLNTQLNADTLDISGLSSGLYLLNISIENSQITFKIVIE
uniref:lamin tail domain-containing protein n=1 Tax=Flavobacterium sp. TaxID=239 RepID=UPI00404B85CE